MSHLIALVRVALRDGEGTADAIGAAIGAAVTVAGITGTDAPLLQAASLLEAAKGGGKFVAALRAGFAAVGRLATRTSRKGEVKAFVVDGLTLGKMSEDQATTLGDKCNGAFVLAFAECFTAVKAPVKVDPMQALERALKALSSADDKLLAKALATSAGADLLASIERITTIAAAKAATEAAAKAAKAAAPAKAPAKTAAPAQTPEQAVAA